ncbi:50S ribosome-binding GTPase [Candidatus Bathyarchaeota archaeon]|nr:50S ribosome-binding GTPase [Candidatus Bathyarchaeota archaeon]
MPTNLPAEAESKWKEVTQARDPKLKLKLLQEFLSLVPKHKGTAKLCAKVKRQMAVLRREIEEKKRRKVGSSPPKFYVEREGVAQVAVIGLTNSGRSSLLSSVTNAKVKVSDAPFTTTTPRPGILKYEDIRFQLVETPPIFEGISSSRGIGSQTMNLIRNADGLIVILDLSNDPSEQLDIIVRELEKSQIRIEKPRYTVRLEKRKGLKQARVNVRGILLDCTVNDVIKLLSKRGIRNVYLEIEGKATLKEVEEAISTNFKYIPSLILANKYDLQGAPEKYLKLKKKLEGMGLNVLPVSCKTGYNLDRIGVQLFKMFKIIRVYCKEPNEEKASPEPFIMREEATILDLARQIHSDFIKKFSYAKVWSNRLKFSPQKVGLNFKLEDGDTVEIRLRS